MDFFMDFFGLSTTWYVGIKSSKETKKRYRWSLGIQKKYNFDRSYVRMVWYVPGSTQQVHDMRYDTYQASTTQQQGIGRCCSSSYAARDNMRFEQTAINWLAFIAFTCSWGIERSIIPVSSPTFGPEIADSRLGNNRHGVRVYGSRADDRLHTAHVSYERTYDSSSARIVWK